MWRKEWKVRKTGEHKGQVMPHWHLILFGQSWIDHRLIRHWWRTILKHTGPLATDVRSAASGEHAARYTAKYVSKYRPCSLDNDAYRDIDFGRPWGFCRPDLVPWLPVVTVLHMTQAQVDEVVGIAAMMWKGLDTDSEVGFTIFHRDARKLAEIFPNATIEPGRPPR